MSGVMGGLMGGLSLTALAACGSEKAAAPDRPADEKPTPTSAFSLVALSPVNGVLRTGLPQRVAFGLGDDSGTLLAKVPSELRMQVFDGGRRPVGPIRTVPAHFKGLPRAYYPLEVTVEKPGSYTAVAMVGDTQISAAFSVAAPADIAIPQVGDPMPRLHTPTVGDARGVDPICTNDPPCPMHEESLDVALSEQRPTALLISTPAYCQVAICGPVLDVLVKLRTEQPGQDFSVIHAEVYASGEAASKDIQSAELAPTVEALALTFEPCLLIADRTGHITRRLDAIFDETEVQDALQEAAPAQ